MDANLALAKSAVKKARRIVFLGGAGVSTASGIPDFRSPQGIYNVHSKYGVPYEVMLSHSYFETHTDTFYDFYWSSMFIGRLEILPLYYAGRRLTHRLRHFRRKSAIEEA